MLSQRRVGINCMNVRKNAAWLSVIFIFLLSAASGRQKLQLERNDVLFTCIFGLWWEFFWWNENNKNDDDDSDCT